MIAAIDWNGPTRQPCPACDRGQRDKALAVTINDDGTGVAYCHRCQYTERLAIDRQWQRPGKAPARPQKRARHEGLAPWARDLLDATTGVQGTVGEQYLLTRHCALPPADSDLRFHPNLPHPSGDSWPALLALGTDVLTREPITLLRTWLARDGSGKANVEPHRANLYGHRKQGAVVRLWPDEAVATGLAVCEGIETCLTLAHGYRPVWAAVDAGNLAVLPVLPGIECLVIGADHDPPGIKAATTCAARWRAAGVDVLVITPTSQGDDFNDLRREADHELQECH